MELRPPRLLARVEEPVHMSTQTSRLTSKHRRPSPSDRAEQAEQQALASEEQATLQVATATREETLLAVVVVDQQPSTTSVTLM